MELERGALGMVCGSLLLCATAVARSGRRQPAHRGWLWWVAALVVAAAGAALAVPAARAAGSVNPTALPWAATAVQALMLAWPVLLLVGLRRFHARSGLPAQPVTDAVALGLGLLALPWLPGPAVLGVHLYVAALAWSARPADDGGPLRLIGSVVALAALPVAVAPWTAHTTGTVLPQALGNGPAGLVCAFALLASMADRTERELRQSRRRLRVLAGTDPLTGVANRRQFEESAARRLRQPAAVSPALLLLDIDHFKQINDRLGHAAGDRALRLVGRCIQDALRAGDIAGRLGGDEFALVLTGTSLPQAMGVAERVVSQLQARSAEHHLPLLSLSFGLVQWLPAESVDDALHRADQALYEAKRQGRSRAVAAHREEDQPVFSESQRLGLTPF
jgi:diguanylate cyclase (GGDEF)-like protein